MIFIKRFSASVFVIGLLFAINTFPEQIKQQIHQDHFEWEELQQETDHAQQNQLHGKNKHAIQPIVSKTVLVEALKKQCIDKTANNNQPLAIDYEHLFAINEINSTTRSGHLRTPKLHGWHHDYQNKLERWGLVKYNSLIQGPCGSFHADPVINGSPYFRKSFFPPQWTEKKVVEKILEAFERADKTALDGKQGYQSIDSNTACGLPVKIIFDPQRSLIVTAYPHISAS